MNARATITSKGQLTVPKAVRKRLNLKSGDRVDFVEVNGEFVLRPRNARAVDFAGVLGPPPDGTTLTVEEMNEAVMDAVAADDERIMREWKEDRE